MANNQPLPPCISRTKSGRLKLDLQMRIRGENIRRRKTLPPGTTVEQAEAALRLLRDEVQLEMTPQAPPSVARPTLADWVCDVWLPTKTRRIRESTRGRYARTLARHILPVIGHVYADAIGRRHVEDWVVYAEGARVDGDPYAQETVTAWWRLLCAVLRDLAADTQVSDPTARVRPPKTHTAPRREQGTLTLEGLGRLLAVTRAHFPQWHAHILTLAYTGIRLGESCGARWEDLDGQVLRIDRSASRGLVTATKTGVGREVYLHPVVTDALAEHRRRMIAEQHPGLEHGWMFPAAHGGLRLGPSLQKPLTEAAELAGLDIHVTPQVLRRTFNTLLAQANVATVVLHSQMGHTTEAMTQRYAGVGVEAKAGAVLSVFGRVSDGGSDT